MRIKAIDGAKKEVVRYGLPTLKTSKQKSYSKIRLTYLNIGKWAILIISIPPAITISHFHQSYFKSCFLDLPSLLLKTLEKGGNRFQELKETIRILEDAIGKALNIQEQIRVLQSLKSFLPKEEIEMIEAKSEAKIQAALVLHQLVKELEKDPGLKTKIKLN